MTHRRLRNVYFAQRRNPDGLIKIGSSADPQARCAQMGCEILAVIPGSTGREAALHMLFDDLRSPRGTEREWFRSDLRIWRVICEAVDAGDLSWLPAELHSGDPGCPSVRDVVAYFGSAGAAERAMGYATIAGYMAVGSKQGRYVAARLLLEGRVPSYVLPARAEAA